MSDLKKQLYKELEIKNAILVEGINVNPIILIWAASIRNRSMSCLRWTITPMWGSIFP